MLYSGLPHPNKKYQITQMAEPERFKYYHSLQCQAQRHAEIWNMKNSNQRKAVNVKFLNTEHKLRMAQLLAKAEIDITNTRLTPFLYIVAGNEFLYSRLDSMYNFYTREIDKRVLFNGIIPVTTQEWQLVDIAIALNDEGFPVDLYNCFCGLDGTQLELALEAIRLRFINAT